ncbi:MAG TPA: hypothetical protein VHA12_00145 [Candidatus Nanoarchaeia archaeon]|nr:hypothetical protein [Candidatus Nanoarchaeia archaeon]
MQQALTLIIYKKTLVPTKRQIKHQYRSDWKLVEKLDNAWTESNLKCFGHGKIEWDSELIYLIHQRYGDGEYMISAFRKGRRGLYLFMKFICNASGFMRKKKKPKLKFVGMKLNEETNELQEQYEEDESKSGCNPYLRSNIPTYDVWNEHLTINDAEQKHESNLVDIKENKNPSGNDFW